MEAKSNLKKKKKSKKEIMVKERAASYKVSKEAVKDILPYAGIEINNFRCFDTFSIDSFNRINLITGVNNSGKTSLLEAIFLHLGQTNPGLAIIVNSWRGLNIISEAAESQWESLFWRLKDSQDIKIKGWNSIGLKRSLVIRSDISKSIIGGKKDHPGQAESISSPQQGILFKYTDENGREQTAKATPVFIKTENRVAYDLRIEPTLPSVSANNIFVSCRHGSDASEEIHRFSSLRKKEKDPIILNALRIIEPRLDRLEILMYQGTSMIHGYLKGFEEPLPSPLLGDGVRRALTVLLAIGAAENGVVLVDEIENGIHHSAMKALWRVIAEAARTFNCQIFATTHSEECIYAAHDAMKETKSYDLVLYRLDRKNGSITAVGYDEERLDAALSIPLEVRGWPEE